ncbi:hypothetical protein K1T71_013901 [Dendrolimus kikuchii]|uniref:Uncharacterized protein n=1 Tax=Dendrolimus kikuchii TaxID=765133 RepID=A0ACC1CG96_9NEOP|nr:hypothetical protein K1T71_013901 [Dendrolimus kikuchii]
MFQIIIFGLFFNAVCGHSKVQTLQNEADMQSALIPQELNPEFTPNKDAPWRISLPIARIRRYAQLSADESVNVAHHLKKYTRIASCVVLIISAIVEIVLYTVDYYNNL